MKKLLFLGLMALTSACVQSVDIDGPAYVRKPVLMGILHPDSLLTVRLSWSNPTANATMVQPITTGIIAFYKDDKLLGTAEHIGTGKYQLAIKPTGNHTYGVRAQLADLPVIEAEDFMPDWGGLSLTVSDQNPENTNQNPDFSLKTMEGLSSKAVLWLGVYSTRYWLKSYSTDCIENGRVKPGCTTENTEDNYVTTRSAILDPFNGYFDAFSNHYANNSPARVRMDLLTADPTRTIIFSQQNQGERWTPSTNPDSVRPIGENIAEITFVGPAYDRYLKSALVAYRNRLTDFDGDLFNPFAEPTPVYSNVKNGLGVFGARNGRYILLKLKTTYEFTR